MPPPQLAKGKEVHEPVLKNAHAVIVGISQYQDPSAPSLKFPADDAKSIRALLQSLDGTSGSVFTLIDQAATRQAILNRLQSAVSGAQRGDTVLFYFGGHDAEFLRRLQRDAGWKPALRRRGNLQLLFEFAFGVRTLGNRTGL